MVTDCLNFPYYEAAVSFHPEQARKNNSRSFLLTNKRGLKNHV
jgi:hypothetical protein